jgi:hypothetical protein
MTQYCISWAAVVVEWLAKGAGRWRELRAVVGFLSGTPNSQAHDFSMRALRQVQIARRAENSKAIAAMHRRCA